MPPELAYDAHSWLARAASSLALAKVARPEGCFWEDLSFHAQQAAEKALKAVLIAHKISFRYVHDLNELVATLEKGGVQVPPGIKATASLNEFAVVTRYPGCYEAVTEEDHQQAVAAAEQVLAWARGIVSSR